MSISRLPLCEICNLVVNKKEAVYNMSNYCHIQCYNELVDDLNKLEMESMKGKSLNLHSFTPSIHTGACMSCRAPSKDECIGENLREVLSICDL